jgi:hypothetical protein
MRLATAWAMCVLVCCAGCGGGGNGTVAVTNADTTNNSIVGRWVAQTIQGPDQIVHTCPASVMVGNGTAACGLVDTQIYRVDGSYTDLNGDQRGTWSMNGSTLTISIAGQPAQVYNFSVNGDTLTEQRFTNGGSVVITYQRQ